MKKEDVNQKRYQLLQLYKYCSEKDINRRSIYHENYSLLR